MVIVVCMCVYCVVEEGGRGRLLSNSELGGCQAPRQQLCSGFSFYSGILLPGVSWVCVHERERQRQRQRAREGQRGAGQEKETERMNTRRGPLPCPFISVCALCVARRRYKTWQGWSDAAKASVTCQPPWV